MSDLSKLSDRHGIDNQFYKEFSNMLFLVCIKQTTIIFFVQFILQAKDKS